MTGAHKLSAVVIATATVAVPAVAPPPAGC
jgi:hypothetical protein